METDTKLQRLFGMLRACGAGMIVTAAGTFLVQSWDTTGDVPRYLALLGSTALLPLVAYLCGIRFQEGRSARVLILTFLALVPIHAGVLGGFVLSRFGKVETSLAPVARWVAPSPSAAVLLTAGAAAVLTPLMWGAFRVLERRHAGFLTAMGVIANGLILVPSRSVVAATLSALSIAGAAAACALRIKPETRESKLSVVALLSPALVIVARQVCFYDVSSAFWASILGTGAIGLFAMGRQSEDISIERLAIVPAMLATGALLDEIAVRLALTLSTTWLAYGLFTGAAFLAFAWHSARSRRFFVRAAVVTNALVATAGLLFDPRPWAALEAIAIGLGASSYGYVRGRRPLIYVGWSLAGLGLLVEVVHAIEVFEASGWLALAGFGVALVALTGWLERRARLVRGADRTVKVSSPGPTALPR